MALYGSYTKRIISKGMAGSNGTICLAFFLPVLPYG